MCVCVCVCVCACVHVALQLYPQQWEQQVLVYETTWGGGGEGVTSSDDIIR